MVHILGSASDIFVEHLLLRFVYLDQAFMALSLHPKGEYQILGPDLMNSDKDHRNETSIQTCRGFVIF